jgi:hypothetical protein
MTSKLEEYAREELGLAKRVKKPSEPSGMEIVIRENVRRPPIPSRPEPSADDVAESRQRTMSILKDRLEQQGKTAVEVDSDLRTWQNIEPSDLESQVRREMNLRGPHQPSPPSELEKQVRRGRLV